MNQNQIIALGLRGMLTKGTADEQAKFAAAEADIKALLEKHGDSGKLALMIYGIELMGEE